MSVFAFLRSSSIIRMQSFSTQGPQIVKKCNLQLNATFLGHIIQDHFQICVYDPTIHISDLILDTCIQKKKLAVRTNTRKTFCTRSRTKNLCVRGIY